MVLIKIKFLTSIELSSVARKASAFWLLALVLMAWQAIHNLIKGLKEEAKLLLMKDKLDAGAYDDAVKKAKAKRLTNTLSLIKAVADSITASQGLGWPKRFIGHDFNDGLCGAGGFLSSYLTCWAMWK